MNTSLTIAIVGLVIALTMLLLMLLSRVKDKTSKRKTKTKDRNVIIREATKKLNQNPRDPVALSAMANIYYQDQEWEKAYATYEILLDIATSIHKVDEFETAVRFGVSAIKTNHLVEATRGFFIAKKIKPNDFEVNYNLGYINFLQADYEKAISLLKTALLANPDNLQTQRYLGFSYHKAGRYREALPYLKKTVDLQPDDKEALFAMAECIFESGSYDRSLKIFSHLRPDPVFGPQSALYAGIIHLQSNQLDKAIIDFEIGLKHEKIPIEIANDLRYKLAITAIKVQNLTKAIQNLKEIQKVTPGYKDVPTLILRYQELNHNKNLQIYLMAVQSEFVAMCRKIVVQFFPNAKVKISDISVFGDYTDIVSEIDTPRWTDVVLFRFFRNQGTVGELLIRDLHARIKDIKAGKGVCITAGGFTDESKRFTEGRPIDLYDKDGLNKLLNTLDVSKPFTI